MGEAARNDAGEVPAWEQEMLDETVAQSPPGKDEDDARARRRALQLAREQAYFRLALEIDRPRRTKVSPSQLSFFPTDPTLFDDPE
ncbi:MAG TPA: hypothetical protein VIG64_03375 [Actinomycetota bacterium]|jgi:hypothetical protein